MDIIGTIAISFLVSYVYNVIYRPPKIVYYEYSPLPVSHPCKFPYSTSKNMKSPGA